VKAVSGPQLLALLTERLALLTAPVVEGGQGEPLARTARLIQLEGVGDSVEAIREGALNWPAVADRCQHHRVEVTGKRAATTWQHRHRLYVNEALALLAGRRVPQDGPTLPQSPWWRPTRQRRGVPAGGSG